MTPTWPGPGGSKTHNTTPAATAAAAARAALHVSSHKPKPTLEILPDLRFVVFHGSEHEAAPVRLTGRVRLDCPEATSIMKPKIRLGGKRKVSWWYNSGMSAAECVEKRVFWNQEQKLGIESAHKVKAGIIEWPFELELSPSMPESVEGLRENYIVYYLYASVSRPGWNTRDVVAQEHIRIVRTLGSESMESTRSRVNADIWANKISYSISIPSDAVVFGTSIVADVELSPIRKGIRLGKIELQLLETVVKRIQMSEVPDARSDRSKSEETEVAKTEMDFPDNSRVTYADDTVDNPTLADEMFKFQAMLPLPKSLNICRQDVDGHQINVSHRFKLMVNIHNPEGHVSQLVCRLPVKLFISPNLPVDEHNQVLPNARGITDAELNSNEAALIAPPEYGRHHLDQMYSGIDLSGYLSRAGSSAATPAGQFAQSRRGSHENLRSLTGWTDGDVLVGPHGSVVPHLLRDRLTDLASRSLVPGPSGVVASGTAHSDSASQGVHDLHNHCHISEHLGRPCGHDHNASSPYFSPSGPSPHHSIPASTRTSDDDYTSSIHERDYNLVDLSRVPSYTAAVHSSGAATPFSEGPPTYLEATSRPPSPTRNATSSSNSSSAVRPSPPELQPLSPTYTVTPAAASAASCAEVVPR